MGCVSSAPVEEDAGAKPRKEKKPVAAEAPTKEREPGQENAVQLVLLGPGESGKSTIFKQMKIIQGTEGGEGINEEERKNFASIVRDNVLAQFKLLLELTNEENIDFANKQEIRIVFEDETPTWTVAVADILKATWSDAEVQKLFRDRDGFTSDGLPYFIEHMDRIKLDDYVPTEQDLLRVRIRTSGYTRATFRYKGVAFNVVDVGGQRPERRKWVECYADADAVIFCAALSEFDQMLREDKSKPRMAETLHLFHTMSNSELTDMPTILLLNKLDLFKQKLADGKSIKTFFSDYTGKDLWEPSANHIKEAFLSKASQQTQTYPHYCTAVDTDNVKLIWKDVREIVMGRLLNNQNTLAALGGVSFV